MKKIKLSILAVLPLLVGCSNDYQRKHVEQKHYSLDLPNTNVKITEYTIDGCQYLGDLVGDSRSNYLTHKGNCNNPIHEIR